MLTNFSFLGESPALIHPQKINHEKKNSHKKIVGEGLLGKEHCFGRAELLLPLVHLTGFANIQHVMGVGKIIDAWSV